MVKMYADGLDFVAHPAGMLPQETQQQVNKLRHDGNFEGLLGYGIALIIGAI